MAGAGEAVGVGIGSLLLGLAQGYFGAKAKQGEQEKLAQSDAARELISAGIKAGVPIPDDVLKKAYGAKGATEMGPAVNLFVQNLRKQRDATMQTMMQGFGDDDQSAGAPPQPALPQVGAAPPQVAQPNILAPFMRGAGPAQVAPGTTFEPAGGGQGGIGAPQIPSGPIALRPTVSRTLTTNPETGQTSLSMTKTPPSQAEQIRLGLETERAGRERAKFPTEYQKGIVELQAAQQKLAREQTIFEQQQDARAGIQTLMEQSSASDDPRVKQKSFEQALAIAAGAGLKDVETLLKAHMTPDKPVKVDLGIPHEAEFVASTGLNPKTMEPVDAKTHQAAIAATKAREARVVRQNEALAKVRTGEIGERVAVSGAVRGLVKESDAVATFVTRVDQIEGALKTMEKNLNVYPTTVLGRPSAQFSRLIQDDRGRVIAQIEQAINILQSAEARFMANEVGRIPQQLERQWREVLADPSKVTRKTAEALIASTRQRLRDMGSGKERAVRARAGVATRLGVPRAITDAFVQGDTESLKLSLGDAFGSGALPPTLNEDDLK